MNDIRRAGRLGVYQLFRAQAMRRPARLAVEQGTYSMSYRTLDGRVTQLAAALARRGIGHGDRIAILSENRSEYVETKLAAARLGAIVACQNWRLAGGELEHCIRLVTPRLMLVSPRHAAALAAIDTDGVVTVELGPAYEAMIAEPGAPVAAREIDPEDGLVILYTSGTTGLPKAALISHRAEIARMCVLRMDCHAGDDDGFLAWAPMFHMGSSDQVLGALMSGAPVLISDGFNAETMVDVVARHRLGWLLLMPGAIEPIVALMQARGTVPAGVCTVGAMADLVPLELVAALSGLMRAPYLNSFGSTETGLPPFSGGRLPPGEIPASLSKQQSSLCDFRLVDPDGADVPDGEPGDLAVRGPTVFSGYWKAPDTNLRDFKDGWFRMGDLFRRNPNGSFDFVDRSKYMIKSGGENIYPAEIERVLLADPRVADAVIVRKRDLKWGEVPVAFIAAKNTLLSKEDVDGICRGALAGYKRPREIRFIRFEDFPRSTTGKILRHEMEKLV